MAVLALQPGTEFDHFHYIVYCEQTREAVTIDPYDESAVLVAAEAYGLRLTSLINTHEHWDHAGQNASMKARLDLLVLAPRAAAGTIRPIDRMLAHGDTITIGSSVTLEVLAMPGHTMTHIGLLGRDERGQPFLIAGDTLFAAGAGNCGYGGHAPTLYDTLTYVIGSLDGATQLYPGHDYLARNLRFATLLEPSNADVSHLIAELQSRPSGDARFTTLDEERRINPFLRCASPELRSRLEQLEPSMAGAVSDKEVFVALRCYRDRWTDSIPQ